jgi:DNA (cytosine-5)-methyltransferase 1
MYPGHLAVAAGARTRGAGVSKQTSYASITDLFCGAGGSTTGATQAGAEVLLAVNHWDRAIETHNTNYPGIIHVKTDISTADPRNFPSTLGLVASPECTSHSLSKGKKRKNLNAQGLWEAPVIDPAEERSRCTMWDPIRFAEYHNYQFVIIENVVDARYWSLWDAWLAAWKALGYRVEIVYLNSMFAHPTPQSRDRMYIVCTREGNPKPNLAITPEAWCPLCAKTILAVQSWKNPRKPFGKYGKSGQYLYRCPQCAAEAMPYYYAAANAIDWSLPATRIGDRKKSLQPKTMERIRYGLAKFRQGEPFFVQVNKTSDRLRSVMSSVFPTKTADNGLGLVSPFLMSVSHSSHSGYVYNAQSDPFGTQTGREDVALVNPPFTFSMNHGEQANNVLEQPHPTQTSYDDVALCMPPFIVELRHSNVARGLTDAFSTFCAGGEHHALITPPFMLDHVHEYRVRAITEPLSTVVAEGNHQSVILPPAYLMTYYNNGQMAPVEQATPTVTTLERHALIMADRPLIEVEDCGFRMLEPHEIKAAMAFPSTYRVTGNRREQVKQLGNAVTPPVMKLLVERALASLGYQQSAEVA